MLSTPFIKLSNSAHPSKALILSLLVLTCLIMQGCSSLSDNKTSSDKELHHLGKDIVDMVTVNDKQQTLAANEKASKTQAKNKQLSPTAIASKNLYLEQQASSKVSAANAANFKAAVSLMHAKKWHKAQQLLDKIIAQQPELSGSYVNKALIFMQQNQLAAANKQLIKAITANPLNPYAHNLQGQVARLQGDFSLAEKSYRQALTIWPQYPQAQLNMAILLELYRGQLVASKKYYQAYLKIKPQDKQAQRWLAGLNIKIKRAGITTVNADNKNIGKASKP
jgi:Tfp pilus assembly protein PilF/uncharacterized protein YceK